MSSRFFLCLLILFSFMASLVSFGEEIENWTQVGEVFDNLPNSPDKTEIEALYSAMKKHAIENADSREEVDIFRSFYLGRWFGYDCLYRRYGHSYTNNTIPEQTPAIGTSNIHRRNVKKPTFKGDVLRCLELRVLLEIPEKILPRELRLAKAVALFRNLEKLREERKKNPFATQNYEYVNAFLSNISNQHGFAGEYDALVSEELKKLDFGNGNISSILAKWRDFFANQKQHPAKAHAAAAWLYRKLDSTVVFKTELPDVIPVTATTTYLSLFSEYVNAEFFNISPYVDISFWKPLVPEAKPECNHVPEWVLYLRAASDIASRVAKGTDKKDVRDRVIDSIYREGYSFFSLCYPNSINEIIYASRDQRLRERTDRWERIASGNMELTLVDEGKTEGAWFFGDFSFASEEGKERIGNDFVYPLIEFQYAKDTQRDVSLRNYESVKFNCLQNMEYLLQLLNRTDVFNWHRDYYMNCEFSPGILWSINRELKFDFTKQGLAKYFQNSKMIERTIATAPSVSPESIKPETALELFAPILVYYYPEVSYKLYAVSDYDPVMDEVGFVRPVIMCVVSPPEDAEPEKAESFLIAKECDWVYRTGAFPGMTNPWTNQEFYSSQAGKKLLSKASDIARKISENTHEDFKKIAHRQAKAKAEREGKPEPEEKQDEEYPFAEIENKQSALEIAFQELGGTPDEEKYARFVQYICNSHKFTSTSRHSATWFYATFFKENFTPNLLLPKLLGIPFLPPEISNELITNNECNASCDTATWKKNAILLAALNNLLTERARLISSNQDKSQVDALTFACFVLDRFCRNMECDLLNPYQNNNYKWMIDQLTLLDANYGYIKAYSTLVLEAREELNITATGNEGYQQWRKATDRLYSPYQIAAAIMWLFENVGKDTLFGNNLPDSIETEDLKTNRDFLDKYLLPDVIDLNKVQFRNISPHTDIISYSQLMIALFCASPSIENGQDIPLRRKFFASKVFSFSAGRLGCILSILPADSCKDIRAFADMNLHGLYRIRTEEKIPDKQYFEEVETFEGPGLWLESTVKIKKFKGNLSDKQMQVLPILYSIDYDGKISPFSPDKISLKPYLDCFEQEETNVEANYLNAKLKFHFPCDFGIDYDLTKSQLLKSCDSVEFRKIHTEVTDEDIVRLREQNATPSSLFALRAFYKFPRTRWTVFRAYVHFDEGTKTWLPGYILYVRPFENDTPISGIISLRKKGMSRGSYRSILGEKENSIPNVRLVESDSYKELFESVQDILGETRSTYLEKRKIFFDERKEKHLQDWGSSSRDF